MKYILKILADCFVLIKGVPGGTCQTSGDSSLS